MKNTGLMVRPVAAINLVGGLLCLECVNNVGGRVIQSGQEINRADSMIIMRDKLGEYADMLAWGVHANLLSEMEADSLAAVAGRDAVEAVRVLTRAKDLREAIHRICRSVVYAIQPVEMDLRLLNIEIVVARVHQRLASDGKQFAWRWEEGNMLDRMLWPVALSAAELLTHD